MALSDDDIARIMVSIPEPVSDSGNDVAVWATNLCIAIEAETRKQDDALIRQLVEALEVTASDVCQVAHHKKRDQHGSGDVCPVQARHDEAIAAGRARLEGNAVSRRARTRRDRRAPIPDFDQPDNNTTARAACYAL